MMKSTKEKGKELEAIKKAREISGIAKGDSREIRDSVVKEVVKSIGYASGRLKSCKDKSMTLENLDKLLKGSKLTEKDCMRLGDKVKQRAWAKLKKEGW